MESNIINTLGQEANPNGTNTNPKYRFTVALRPFSLPVALVTCSLGVTAAMQLQTIDTLTALLVLLAGLLLQAGVNLINDHADLKNPVSIQQLSTTDITRITHNYHFGWACFTVCAIIGLYLTYQTNLFLLALAIIGGLGAIFYTTEPIHYKRRGLGVVLVFFLMGVLMVYGACFAVTGQHNIGAIYISIPVSFLTSALLLSNELRDYASDHREGLKTLTVRWGLGNAKRLYIVLIICSFASIMAIITDKPLSIDGLIFIPSMLIAMIAIYTLATKDNLTSLPPITGRLYLTFGVSEILFLLM